MNYIIDDSTTPYMCKSFINLYQYAMFILPLSRISVNIKINVMNWLDSDSDKVIKTMKGSVDEIAFFIMTTYYDEISELHTT